MVRFYVTHISGILSVLAAFTVHAVPLIEIDKTIFDCGAFVEGKSQKAMAIYNVKNSGDSLLKIESVRPGCGCVVAEYDTFIAPGKTGKIMLEARLDGYIGSIKKSATIASNAKNTPTLRITLTAAIKQVISISQRHIVLPALKDQKPFNLYLSSSKKDLEVTGIDFRPYDNTTSGWQNQLALPIMYKWSKTDSISSDGSTVFMLSLNSPDLKKSTDGEIILTTNHPDKKEIRLSGRIE
ncbi:MAG TPA: DUF1573 domain-containing protein [Chitinispirillaceae bacterium]|nr:DUF1573 domain-containing protein [Chitinispirillaceae bacterium]